MITAGVTAAIAALLSLFGIKPGPYLVGVAIAVKIVVVLASVLLGARLMRKRRASAAAAAATGPTVTSSGNSPAGEISKRPLGREPAEKE